MTIRENDTFELVITDMGKDGEGIGKSDGFTWFVKDAVIGDTIEAKALKIKKSYGYAGLVRFITLSKDRAVPVCPAAGRCGGCRLQSMSYEKQLEFKADKTVNDLARIGGFTDIPFEGITGMDDPWRYRDKVQFKAGPGKDGDIVAGFYAAATHEIIPAEDCMIGFKENREILEIILKYMKDCNAAPYDEAACDGLVRDILIRKGYATGELMVCLDINGRDIPDPDRLVDGLCRIEGMTSISLSVNTSGRNMTPGKEMITLFGPGYINDCIGDVRFRISPGSFYQVNPVQTQKLYSKALEYASLTGNETVWDLYCGIGTISLFLAQRAKKVYGVEIVPEAVDDARENAKLNGIVNAEFFCGKAEEVLPEMYEKDGARADVIVVDPPRKGCGAGCLDAILKIHPAKVVYVSCDSATLSRDLKILCSKGYRLEKTSAFDMFPQTVHCESVSLLVPRSHLFNSLN